MSIHPWNVYQAVGIEDLIITCGGIQSKTRKSESEKISPIFSSERLNREWNIFLLLTYRILGKIWVHQNTVDTPNKWLDHVISWNVLLYLM